MNAVIAKCGQVKRRLKNGQRLTGEVLAFALSVLPPSIGNANDALFVGLAQKLMSGDQLTEYEYHVLVEVILLHVRLSERSHQRQASLNGTATRGIENDSKG